MGDADSDWGRGVRTQVGPRRQPMRRRRTPQSLAGPNLSPRLTPSHRTLARGGGCDCCRVLQRVRGDLCLSAAAAAERLGRRFA